MRTAADAVKAPAPTTFQSLTGGIWPHVGLGHSALAGLMVSKLRGNCGETL
jgi:hypothetical protein